MKLALAFVDCSTTGTFYFTNKSMYGTTRRRNGFREPKLRRGVFPAVWCTALGTSRWWLYLPRTRLTWRLSLQYKDWITVSNVAVARLGSSSRRENGKVFILSRNGVFNVTCLKCYLFIITPNREALHCGLVCWHLSGGWGTQPFKLYYNWYKY